MPLPSGRDAQIISTGLFTKTTYTVATLPSVAENVGRVHWVSDLLDNPATSSGKVVVGGGTTIGRACSDGTNWRIYGWTA